MIFKTSHSIRFFAAGAALGVVLATTPAFGQQPEPDIDPLPGDTNPEVRDNTLTPTPEDDTASDDDAALADPGEIETAQPTERSDDVQVTTGASPAHSDLSVSAQEAKAELQEEEAFRPFLVLQSDFVAFDNADFRPFEDQDPISVIDAFDSDDRTLSSYTSLRGGFEYDFDNTLRVELAGGYKTLWGGDDLIYISRAFVGWTPMIHEAVSFEVAAGRQHFEIGGAARDFFFDDIIDAARVEFGAGVAGSIGAFADYNSAGARPEDISFTSGLGRAQNQSFRSNGDNNTYRFGARYQNTELVDGLEFRAFGFYADIGSTDPLGTGADRTFGQAFGIQADGDYTWMAGTRIGYGFDIEGFELKFYGEFAYSDGIDRKQTNLGVFDVGTTGSAFGGAIMPAYTFNENFGLRGAFQFYRADGAEYAGENGVQFNHGFVSMKSSQVGGLIANRISGWHPSAYIATNGVAHQPHGIERIAGSQVLHVNLGVDLLRQLSVDFDLWTYADTMNSNFDFTRTTQAASELPFGYDEFDLRAQERAGKSLGLEVNARVKYRPLQVLSFYLEGGLLVPGEYYEIEVDRRVGTGGESQRVAIGANEPATAQAVMFGTILEL